VLATLPPEIAAAVDSSSNRLRAERAGQAGRTAPASTPAPTLNTVSQASTASTQPQTAPNPALARLEQVGALGTSTGPGVSGLNASTITPSTLQNQGTFLASASTLAAASTPMASRFRPMEIGLNPRPAAAGSAIRATPAPEPHTYAHTNSAYQPGASKYSAMISRLTDAAAARVRSSYSGIPRSVALDVSISRPYATGLVSAPVPPAPLTGTWSALEGVSSRSVHSASGTVTAAGTGGGNGVGGGNAPSDGASLNEAAAIAQRFNWHNIQTQQEAKIKLLEAQLNQLSADALADRESWLSSQLDLHRQLADAKRQLAAAQAALIAEEAIRADADAAKAARELVLDQIRRAERRRKVATSSTSSMTKDEHSEHLASRRSSKHARSYEGISDDRDIYSDSESERYECHAKTFKQEYARELASRRAFRQEDWERMRGLSRYKRDGASEDSGEDSGSEASEPEMSYARKGVKGHRSSTAKHISSESPSSSDTDSESDVSADSEHKSRYKKRSMNKHDSDRFVDKDTQYSAKTRVEVERVREEENLRDELSREATNQRRSKSRGKKSRCKRDQRKKPLLSDSSSSDSDSSQEPDSKVAVPRCSEGKSASSEQASSERRRSSVTAADLAAAAATLEQRQARRMSQGPVPAVPSPCENKQAQEKQVLVRQTPESQPQNDEHFLQLKQQVQQLQEELRKLRSMNSDQEQTPKPLAPSASGSECTCKRRGSQQQGGVRKCSPEEIRRLEGLIAVQQSVAESAMSEAEAVRRTYLMSREVSQVSQVSQFSREPSTSNTKPPHSEQQVQRTFAFVSESDGGVTQVGRLYEFHGDANNGYWTYSDYNPSDGTVAQPVPDKTSEGATEPVAHLTHDSPQKGATTSTGANPEEQPLNESASDEFETATVHDAPLPKPEIPEIVAPLATAVNLLSPVRRDSKTSVQTIDEPPTISANTPAPVRTRCLILSSLSESNPTIAPDANRISRALRRASIATSDAEEKAQAALETRDRLAQAISAASELEGPSPLQNVMAPLHVALQEAANLAQQALSRAGLLMDAREELFKEADRFIERVKAQITQFPMQQLTTETTRPVLAPAGLNASLPPPNRAQRRLSFEPQQSPPEHGADAVGERVRRARVIWDAYATTVGSHEMFLAALTPELQAKWRLSDGPSIEPADLAAVESGMGLVRPRKSLGEIPSSISETHLRQIEREYDNLRTWYKSAMEDAL